MSVNVLGPFLAHATTQVSLGLMGEVEKVLQGNHDAIWGLLNHLREVCTSRQPFALGPAPGRDGTAALRLAQRSASAAGAAASGGGLVLLCLVPHC